MLIRINLIEQLAKYREAFHAQWTLSKDHPTRCGTGELDLITDPPNAERLQVH